MTDRIHIDDDTFLLVLTGAGVSAESGLPTFRDANGLWENHTVEEVASLEGFSRDTARSWRFYSQRRHAAINCLPNAGHHAIAEVEARLGDRFLLISQNVDDLHLRAGSKRMIELHGNLFTSRCSKCQRPPFPDETVYPDGDVPQCDRCNSAPLRPQIVWFGEAIAAEHLERIFKFMSTATKANGHLVFIAAGTSGTVYPAAGLVEQAARAGAETHLINKDPAENGGAFDHFIQGKSAEILPALWRF